MYYVHRRNVAGNLSGVACIEGEGPAFFSPSHYGAQPDFARVSADIWRVGGGNLGPSSSWPEAFLRSDGRPLRNDYRVNPPHQPYCYQWSP